MKKIISFLVIPLCLFFCACNDDDDNGGKTSGFTIESQDLFFGAKASEGSIVVKSDNPITATSSHPDWCTPSVSGNTVTVTTASNFDIVSRDAKIKITSGGESIILCVHQEGKRLVLYSTSAEISWLNNRETSVSYESSDVVTLENNADWLVCEVKDSETLVFKAGINHGATRSTIVNVNSLGTSKSLTITQLGGLYCDDLVGEWTLRYTNSAGEAVSSQLTFEPTGENTFLIGPMYSDSYTYSINAKYDEGESKLTFPLSQYAGPYSIMSAWWVIHNYTAGYITNTAANETLAMWSFLEADKLNPKFTFHPEDTSWIYPAESLTIYVFLGTTGAGTYAQLRGVSLTKNETVVIP